MRRFLLALGSPLGAFAAVVTPAPGGWPGRYGPFYRTGSTQDDGTTRLQQTSGEIWGKPDRGSNFPSVDAWAGALPGSKPGIEFYTDVEPSPGTPPHWARWRGPRAGVRIEGDWAKIRVNITKVRFRP
jgi:hypothetical protein